MYIDVCVCVVAVFVSFTGLRNTSAVSKVQGEVFPRRNEERKRMPIIWVTPFHGLEIRDE